jgi:hypothetical protein
LQHEAKFSEKTPVDIFNGNIQNDLAKNIQNILTIKGKERNLNISGQKIGRLFLAEIGSKS